MPTPAWNERYTSGGPLPWDTGVPDRHLVELFASGRLPKGRVLEVGCGTGTNSVWLAKQGGDVVGVDLSAAAIERARARANEAGVSSRFAVTDFLQGELSEPPFDLVFDRGCFHVFDGAAEREAFANHVARLLAPGGVWLSLIGSTEGPPREMGPPRRSVRDVVEAIEPVLKIVELRAVDFTTNTAPAAAAWLCLSGRRQTPAQPSTSSTGEMAAKLPAR